MKGIRVKGARIGARIGTRNRARIRAGMGVKLSGKRNTYTLMLLVLVLLATAVSPPQLLDLAYGENNGPTAGDVLALFGSQTGPSGLPQDDQNIPIFFDDRIITGVSTQADAFFQISRNRKVQAGSYVDIYYSHSPTLLPKVSSLTVLLNDLPIGSVSLEADHLAKIHWRIDISHIDLNPGFHKLSFLAHMEVTNAACANPHSPSNWMVVFKDSRIHLNLAESTDAVDLGWYPSPFIEQGSSSPLQTALVVPDELDQSEFNAAARLVQYLTKQASFNRLPVAVYTESELTETVLSRERLIWIGGPDKWRAAGQRVLEALQREQLLEEVVEHAIGLVHSPWNPHLTHMIITGGEIQMANAASILTDEQLYNQLQGRYSALSDKVIEKEKEEALRTEEAVAVSFGSMGYGNIVVENVLESSTRIFYNLPANWDIRDGAKLRLVFSHTQSLNLAQSVITVKVNGIPVSSRLFGTPDQLRSVIEMELPQNLLTGRRTLDIDVDLEFVNTAKVVNDDEEGCPGLSLRGNWFVLDPASSLTFTPVERKILDLQSFPYPFILNGAWTDTVVLFDNRPGHDHLSAAMTFIGIIGRDAVNHAGLSYAVAGDPGLAALTANRNVIYLGETAKVPAFLNGQEGSLVQFHTDGRVFSSDPNIELLNELQSRSAVIQLTRAGQGGSQAWLLMAVTPGARLSAVSQAFLNPAESFKIAGKLAVADSRGVVHPFGPTAEEQLAELEVGEPQRKFLFYDRERDVLSGLSFIIIFILLLVSLVVMIWHMIRRR